MSETESKYKCGPGYGTRGEKAYNLRCDGLPWREIALTLEMPSATAETNIESAATNVARKYARANKLPWPIGVPPKEEEEELPPEPGENVENALQERQRLAYEARAGGGGWSWVAEVTLYSCIPHAVAGARRYAKREGKPWPIPT